MKLHYTISIILVIGGFSCVGFFGGNLDTESDQFIYGLCTVTQGDLGDDGVVLDESLDLDSCLLNGIENQSNESASDHLVSAYLLVVTRNRSGLEALVEENPESFGANSKAMCLARQTATLLEKQIPGLIETGRTNQIIDDCFSTGNTSDATMMAHAIKEYVNDLKWISEKCPMIASGVRGSKVAYPIVDQVAEHQRRLLLENARKTGVLNIMMEQITLEYYRIYLSQLELAYP